MAMDLTLSMSDRPGSLAVLGQILDQSGIRVEGSCVFRCEGNRTIHILIQDDDVPGLWRTLSKAGIKVRSSHQVLIADIQDRPSSLGELTCRIAEAGILIEHMYLTPKGQLVLRVDNLDKARAALKN